MEPSASELIALADSMKRTELHSRAELNAAFAAVCRDERDRNWRIVTSSMGTLDSSARTVWELYCYRNVPVVQIERCGRTRTAFRLERMEDGQ